MQTNLTWKKGLFSSNYSIYSNGTLIGELRDKSFSQSAYGEMDGKKYVFKTKGFFKQHTDIIDASNGRIIGQISYNNWMTKATISLNHKTVFWKYDNIWNSKWSIFDSEGTDVRYFSSSNKGSIESNSEDPLLILSGLFVTNYYVQMTIAVMVGVFVPIITTLSN
ncbi:MULTISPECIES: hypothetical protein [unclassified Saccharicrinis]|uniref:hypothetical protein n=1 Tax=unclassified Saccharicrinis TaxID=2646859 RepID=UPI003D347598